MPEKLKRASINQKNKEIAHRQGKGFSIKYCYVRFDNDFYKLHLIGAHLFARMEIFTDSCRYTMMDHEWLKNSLSESTENLAYEMVDDAIILTANTAELQIFFKKYADDSEAFIDRTLLLRQ